jgi:hypothetical protein
LGICMPPPPPPPPPPAAPAGAPAAAVPAAPDSTAAPTQDSGVPTSRFTKQDGAPELDENKRGFNDSGDRAILALFSQGNAAIQAMDSVLAQMGNVYVEASRKFFDADATIDNAYQQASFNLGILQQVSQRTEAAGKQAPAGKQPQVGLTAEQQASITEINKALDGIKQNKTAFNQLFSQINDTIGQGKTMASQARQKNLQILQLPNAAAGQGLIGEIQKLSQDLSQLFGQLQNVTVKNFNTTFDQLNTSAKAVDALIQKLQAKSFTLQVAQEQQQQKVEQQAQQQAAKQPAAFVSWFIPEKTPQAPTAGEATAIHYAFKKAADALTYCIQMVYKGYVYGKDFVVRKLSSQPAAAQAPATALAPKPGQPGPQQAPGAQQQPAGTAPQAPAGVPPTGQPQAAMPQQPATPSPAGTPGQPGVPPTQTPAPMPPTTPPPAMPTAMPAAMPG